MKAIALSDLSLSIFVEWREGRPLGFDLHFRRARSGQRTSWSLSANWTGNEEKMEVDTAHQISTRSSSLFFLSYFFALLMWVSLSFLNLLGFSFLFFFLFVWDVIMGCFINITFMYFVIYLLWLFSKSKSNTRKLQGEHLCFLFYKFVEDLNAFIGNMITHVFLFYKFIEDLNAFIENMTTISKKSLENKPNFQNIKT